MKKRVLSMLMVLAMTLTFMAPSAMALGMGPGPIPMSGGEGTWDEAIAPEIEVYEADFTTAADIPSFYAVRAATTDSFTTFGAQLSANAQKIYNALCNAANRDAIRTGQPVRIVWEERNLTGSSNVSAFVSDKTWTDDAQNAVQDAVAAFDRDCSEVFWTDGVQSSYGSEQAVNGEYKLINGTYTASDGAYTHAVFVTLPISVSWQTGGRSISTDEGTVSSQISTIVAQARTKSGAFEQLKYVHDWLTQNNAYNTTAANTSNFQKTNSTPWEAISALSDGLSPVCEGYARAFQLICKQLGIPCILVSGLGDSGAHMWNYVKLDGAWYAVDVTWDDPTPDQGASATSYSWFLKGSTSFTRHTPQSNNFLEDGHCEFQYPTLSTADYVVKEAPAYTVPQNLTATYGNKLSDVSLPAAAAGDTPGTWAWMTPNDSVGNAGSHTFKAKFTPNEITKYNEVTNIDVTVTVNAMTVHPTVTVNGTYAYTGRPIEPTDITITTTEGVSLAKVTDYTVSYGTNTEPGEGTVTVSRVATSNYDFTAVTGKFTINKAGQAALTFNPGTVTYGETLTLNAAGGSGGGAVSYTVTNGTGSATLAADGTTLTPTKAGTVTVKATKAGDSHYNEASATATVTIDKAASTVNVAPSVTITKGAFENLSATVTGANGTIANPSLTYSSADTNKVTVVDGVVTGKDVTTTAVAVTVTFAGDDNHNGTSATVLVSVTNKTTATVTFAATTATAQPYTATGYKLGEQFNAASVTPSGDGTIEYLYNGEKYTNLTDLPSVTAVGTYKVTAVYEDETYYGATEASFTIKKAEQEPLTVSAAASAAYQDTLTLSTGGGSGDGAVTYTVTNGTGSATVSGSTLTATGVGTVTVTATKAADANYNAATSAPVTITIGKAVKPADQAKEVSVYYGAEGEQTATLPVPAVAGQLGTVTYGSPSVTNGDAGIISGAPTVENGVLKYTLASGLDDTAVNKTATISVTVSSTNYADYIASVKITLVDKLPQTAPAAPTLTYTLNGNRATYTVTIPAVTGAEYSFDGTTYKDTNTKDDAAPGAIVTGYIRLKETPTHLASDATPSAPLTLPLIKLLTPTADPASGVHPGTVTVTLACGDAGADIYYTTDGTTPDTGSTLYGGSFDVTSPATVKAMAVKAGCTDSDVLTVTYSAEPEPVYPVLPSTPGTTNTGNTNTDPTTPNNLPAVTDSPIVTPTAPVNNGTAEAVVSREMADQLVEQAASGTSTVVVAPVVAGSVSQTEVTIPASAVSGIAGSSNAELRVETPAADITIPNSALADLSRQGGSVVVTAGESNGIVSIEITAGGKSVDQIPGGVKAEIPVSCTPGTVAMVIDENGDLTPVRKSYADDSGRTMTVPLDGSAQMVFVDNSKSFADVGSTSWAADAVAFASSRELMNGVGSDSFSPNTSMTRGMLAVVLHNLEGNPSAAYSGRFSDVGGSAWYAQAVQWAADNSIIGGVGEGVFAPDAPITREQLVVMLYRYAGQPEASGSLGRFSDSGSVSGWAQQAMAWAVANGIINGSNGALNPQSSATRAEVAQMLMNFVTSGVL